jgi:serine acetyltransferase
LGVDKKFPLTGRSTSKFSRIALHTDAGKKLLIGRGCTIGHRAMLHGCTTEDDMLVGIGAVILNDVTSGPNRSSLPTVWYPSGSASRPE